MRKYIKEDLVKVEMIPSVEHRKFPSSRIVLVRNLMVSGAVLVGGGAVALLATDAKNTLVTGNYIAEEIEENKRVITIDGVEHTRGEDGSFEINGIKYVGGLAIDDRGEGELVYSCAFGLLQTKAINHMPGDIVGVSTVPSAECDDGNIDIGSLE